ncbi:MAG: DMT family transporter [Akkermansiaceae bacterium]|jgi:drug/metabolite transporter (DMT)-like permease|nr:DMT family transporter [Akkermansiaceae bacterium]
MHAAILTAILFALTGVCAAQASSLLGAGRANAWRLVIALGVLALWVHGFGPGLRHGLRPWFLAAGAVGFGLGGWCAMQALRHGGSTLTLLVIECVAALAATAIGWLALGAALEGRQLAWMLLILAGVVLGASPGPLPALPRPLLRRACAFAMAAGCLQAVSINLSKHGFTLAAAAATPVTPVEAAYQRLWGGCIAALVIHGFIRWSSRGRTAPAGPAASFPASPLPAPAWVALNALLGPVLGVTCLLWAVSLVHNPGLVQTVAATATLLSIPAAWWLEGARPRLTYYLGVTLALAGVAGLLTA